MTVKRGVRKRREPVAKNSHARPSELKVKQYMTMPENVILNIRMCRAVLLRKLNQRLLLLSLVAIVTIDVTYAIVPAPSMSDGQTQIRGQD